MSRTLNTASLALLIGLALGGAASAQGGGGGGGGGGSGGADANPREIMNPTMPAARGNRNCITHACDNEPPRPQRVRSSCEGQWLLARDPETWRIVRICERS
ncbi:MAG: hypothetical protein LCH39_07130 [Proteobacteria bacterium]|nr:hypothetical protein [Pseudomonadota bacterium]